MLPNSQQQSAGDEIQLQYMLGKARVKVNLPEQRDSWFFIHPDDTVQDFISCVQQEDKKVKSLSVMSGN